MLLQSQEWGTLVGKATSSLPLGQQEEEEEGGRGGQGEVSRGEGSSGEVSEVSPPPGSTCE